MNRRRWILPTVALFLILAGCGDDAVEPGQPTTGTVAGTVVLVESGLPLADATVLLATDALEVLEVTRVGADGSFRFKEVAAGSRLLYCLADDRMMAQASASRVEVQAGSTWTTTLRMMDGTGMGNDYRVTGRVTDAETGAPVAGAWIAGYSLAEAGNSVRYLMNNSGLTIAVSDEAGFYSLPAWGVTENLEGPVIGLSPVSIGCQGYRSRTFMGEHRDIPRPPHELTGLLPAPADSVLVLDIALAPMPAGGLPPATTGTVRGTMVHDGAPQPGVMVTMTLLYLADGDTLHPPADKVTFHGGMVRSAADGSFAFVVEPGVYALRAGLLPDDGWGRDGGGIRSSFEVRAGEAIDVGVVSVAAALQPLAPTPGSVVAAPVPALAWTAFPDTDYYRVSVGINSAWHTLDLGTTQETRMDWPAELGPFDGSVVVRWSVFAMRRVEGGFPAQTVGAFQAPADFILEAASP